MSEPLKKTRGMARANFTREVNLLKRLVADEDKEQVESGLKRVKEKFSEFLKSHDESHATIDQEDNDMIEESDDIPVENNNIDVSKFDHLCSLPLVKYISHVDILIGQDHAEALMPLEICKGSSGEPFGVRSMFGWSLNGPSVGKGTLSGNG